MDMDGRAVDRLAALFAQAREHGIEIPPDMPLDTPAHQRAAVAWLGRLIWRKERGLP